MMELNHVSAVVNMVQSERPEEAANSKFYVVKAKRGIVTFTKCDGDGAQVVPSMRVSGRNLQAEKLIVSFFQGRKPIPEPKVRIRSCMACLFVDWPPLYLFPGVRHACHLYLMRCDLTGACRRSER